MDTQPGNVITPHDQSTNEPQNPNVGAPPEPNRSPEGPAPTVPSPNPPSEPTSSPDLAVGSGIGMSPTGTATGWQYTQEAPELKPADVLSEDITWSAAEFIEHPKSVSWYGLLMLAALVLATADYFFTKDILSTSVVIIAAMMFGAYARHKPRTRQYHLTPQGLQIGEKLYIFQSFRSFSVTEEGSTASIMFTPLGRFMPPLTIYVPDDVEDRVLDYLNAFLPFEQHRTDVVDGLLRRIHF